MNNFIKFIIGVEGDAAFRSKMKACEDSASEFIGALKAGVGIDLGGKLVNSIAAIPGILQEATARGVAYNRSIADSEVAIANVVKRFKNLDDVAAKAEAAKAIRKIKEVEPEAAGTLQTLIQGFMATYASSAAAGVSIEQNVELVGMFANALANANIPAEQLSQELRAIFTGNITPDAALGKLLQITPEDVANAKAAGNLYTFLVEKVGSLGNAGDTSAVALSSLSSAFDAALGELTKPVQLALDEAVLDLTEAIKAMPQGELQNLSEELAALVREGANLTAWLVRNTDVWVPWAAALGKAAVALAAIKFIDIIVGLGSMVLKLGVSKTAIDAETAALGTNTAAQRANTAARAGNAAAAGGRAALAGLGGVGGAATLVGLAGVLTLESFTAEWNAQADQQEAATRAKMAQNPKFNRGVAGGKAGPGTPQIKAGDEPIDFLTGPGATDADLAAARMAGLGGDELWAAKMQQAGDRRGLLGATLGLGEGFSIDDALAAVTQSGTPEQQAEVVGQIKELAEWEKEIGEMQEENAEHSKQSADEAGKRAAARERELATMKAQLEIADAELSGNERLKIELEAQLRARQIMERLTDAGVPDAEAQSLAERTAGADRDLALARIGDQVADLKPGFGDELTTRGGRGARLRKAARADFADKLRRAGASPEQIDEKLADYDQARLAKQGRGGTTTRSDRDQLGGFANLGVERDSIGTPASDDFTKAFGRKAVPNVGEAITTSPANAETAGAREADALRSAAQASDSLTGSLDAAAGSIDGLNGSVQNAASAMQSAGSAIAALDNAVSNLQSQLSNLRNTSGQ